MQKFLVSFILFLSGIAAFATHNLAGEIKYRHISGLTYEITVTIFADGNQTAIGRRDIEIDWGDNSGRDSLLVREQPTVPGTNSILKRIWREQHTFPGAGSYILRVVDPNRNAGVNNICNSVNEPFTIETLLRVSPFPGQINNSVCLLNDPIDEACVGAKFVYNTGAFDPDGDSIAYEISESKGVDGRIARCYEFPENMTVDAISGDLVWDTPDEAGLFNVAILIKEYRNGILVGNVLRDIQIRVVPGCDNQPPDIVARELVCVEADSTVRIPIVGTDPDSSDLVKLSITGEFFETGFPNPPSISDFDRFDKPATASLVWNTECNNVRLQPYIASIKAEDNANQRGTIVLTTFKNIGIRVIAPAPDSLKTEPIGTSIQLEWKNTRCQNAEGYYIYRRFNPFGFVPSECESGVPSYTGYVKVGAIVGVSNTTFLDDNDGLGLIPGRQYCYLVTKFFLDEDESYASEEVCAEVPKIVPVITNVSIASTDNTTGDLELAWSKPDLLDVQFFPPPYRYLIYKEEEIRSLIDSTNSIDDTNYTIGTLNTESIDHTYDIELYSYGNGKTLVGSTPSATSIFLSISPTDELLRLSWTANVPWQLDSFVVLRKLPNSNTFDSIATVQTTFFIDSNLINGEEYCYLVESYGSYNLTSVNNPLVNLSQEVCARPIDNISPCTPVYVVTGDCQRDEIRITWSNQNLSCSDDISFYRIYRSVNLSASFSLFADNVFVSDTIVSSAGCYTVTSVDSAGNESVLGERGCVDFCPDYELPNVFTPNGDGRNDFYTPLKPYQYVDSIEIIIYNRWGDQVFKTFDPEINWNGEHEGSGEMVSSGVYFFHCQVFEQRINDTEPRIIKGTITILDPLPIQKSE